MSGSEAARRFRRRAVTGHARARREYLNPELREEAQYLRDSIDKALSQRVNTRTNRRVKRIRAGEKVEATRLKRPRPQPTGWGDDDDE